MEGIEFHQRVFVAGQTRSGKSELVNYLFTSFHGAQRLLLDTKGGEWVIEGVEPVSDVEAIDWREPIVHYVTSGTSTDEIDDLFRALEQRRNLLVCVHELGDLCEMSTNKTPASVNRYLTQGGAWGRGFLGASQRPVDMPKRAKTEAQHVFAMVPPLDDEDLKTVSSMIEGTSAKELKAQLEELERNQGKYSFAWFPRGAAEMTVWAPLPEQLRAQIIVQRAEGVR